jgi:CheY-like chemotaxis protein
VPPLVAFFIPAASLSSERKIVLSNILFQPESVMSTPRYPLIMLVDDNELDNFINKKLIETESFASEVIVHSSAVSALEDLKKRTSQKDPLPRIIFLDIMMPGMDGFGFLEEFGRLSEDVRKHCKVVMLSTTESFKDLNRANQNPYVYKFLNKPMNKAVLDAINI